MASETMELECPNCKLMLEIDIAFAGGVCRCSSCGTLMTVPRDPKLERAESLQRPDRPGEPAGSSAPERPSAPARPDAPAGGNQSPTPTPAVQTPIEQPTAASQTASSSTAANAPVDEGVYVTASGKEVRITSQTRIPTAVKRKALKISIVSGFVLFMVGMVAIVLVGIAFMMNSQGSSKRTADQVAADVQKARGNYDPDVNPLLLKQTNVLGLEIASSVVVVFDTSNTSKKWLSMAADATIQGLVNQTQTSANKPMVQVVFASDGGPTLAPEKLAALDDESRQVLKDALLNTRASGQANFATAMNIAVTSAPAQIILITSQDIDSDRLKSISDPLGQSKTPLQFDVVYLGQQPGTLETVVTKHNGTLVNLPVLTLRTWYQNWLDQQQAAEQDTP